MAETKIQWADNATPIEILSGNKKQRDNKGRFCGS